MIQAADIIINKSQLLLIVILLFVFYLLLFRKHRILSAIKFKLPFIGKIYQMDYLKRILLMMGMQLKGGLPLDEALKNLEAISKNYWANKRLNKIKESVNKGGSFQEALSNAGLLFKNSLANYTLLSSTENLPQAMIETAGDLNEYIKIKTEIVIKYLEPTLHILLAILIAFLIFSMYMPLFEIPIKVAGLELQ